MTNIIDFEQYQKPTIEIERTEEFTIAAYKLGDFIKTLYMDVIQLYIR